MAMLTQRDQVEHLGELRLTSTRFLVQAGTDGKLVAVGNCNVCGEPFRGLPFGVGPNRVCSLNCRHVQINDDLERRRIARDLEQAHEMAILGVLDAWETNQRTVGAFVLKRDWPELFDAVRRLVATKTQLQNFDVPK